MSRGFTLTEVMVAITLLTIGALGMAAFTVTIAQANRGATNRTRADEALYEKVEGLQLMDYDAVVDGNDTVDVGGVKIARTWDVTDDTPTKDVKRVVLTATWSDAGTNTSMRTATYISKYGR